VSWLLINLLIGLLGLSVIGMVSFAAWTDIRSLRRSAKEAAAQVGAVTAEVDALQSGGVSRRKP